MQVVEVLHLPHEDRHFPAGIDLIDGRLVFAALVHRDLFGNAVGLHGFLREPQGCGLVTPGGQQKFNRFAFLVHRTVEVFPNAFDLDISLVHAPAAAYRTLVLVEHILKQGQKTDHPAVDSGRINTKVTLLHHFF